MEPAGIPSAASHLRATSRLGATSQLASRSDSSGEQQCAGTVARPVSSLAAEPVAPPPAADVEAQVSDDEIVVSFASGADTRRYRVCRDVEHRQREALVRARTRLQGLLGPQALGQPIDIAGELKVPLAPPQSISTHFLSFGHCGAKTKHGNFSRASGFAKMGVPCLSCTALSVPTSPAP